MDHTIASCRKISLRIRFSGLGSGQTTSQPLRANPTTSDVKKRHKDNYDYRRLPLTEIYRNTPCRIKPGDECLLFPAFKTSRCKIPEPEKQGRMPVRLIQTWHLNNKHGSNLFYFASPNPGSAASFLTPSGCRILFKRIHKSNKTASHSGFFNLTTSKLFQNRILADPDNHEYPSKPSCDSTL